MDDSFRLRVEKTFGSLATAPPASSQPNNLWCLTDEEIEKREWNRGKEDDVADDDQDGKSYPSNLDGFFSKSVDDDDDEDDDVSEKSRAFVKPEDYNDEEWDIRSSVGLDCTLDNEEEEDDFDKVAIGDERTGDYLYMGDVAEQKNGIHKFIRESNKIPAKFTVDEEEDVEAASNFNTLRVSQDNNLKSILKKRGNSMESKMGKRVRFDPECKDEEDEQETIPEVDYSLPAYLRDPSKYVRYTFDQSGDLIDEESNKKACMDFLSTLRGKGKVDIDSEDDIRKNPPKTVIFTPKKANKLKGMEEDVPKKENSKLSFSIDVFESEACDMEEDDEQLSVAENKSISSKKGRQFRVKNSIDDDDDAT